MNTYPAFPVLPNGENNVDNQGFKVYAHAGMTLLDYFAAKAMQAFITADSRPENPEGAYSNPSKAAEWAYQVAEEMIKYRNNKVKWV